MPPGKSPLSMTMMLAAYYCHGDHNDRPHAICGGDDLHTVYGGQGATSGGNLEGNTSYQLAIHEQ